MITNLSRRGVLQGATALPFLASSTAGGAALPPRLRTLPTKLYRGQFNAREGLDGWVFFLILEADEDVPLAPVSLRIAYQSEGNLVREERILGSALAAIARQDVPPSRLTGAAPSPLVYWPQAFRIHCYVPHAPLVTHMLVQLTATDPKGRTYNIGAQLPIVDYQQRTSLVFPFKGPGIISQAGVLNGGHRNRSGCFAIDVLALAPDYAPSSLAGSDRPEDYAGWGRPIFAPASGVVVSATVDRPDQPKDGESNPAYFAPQYPNGGDVGNNVVIDHGNGEFSLIAHIRKGSVRVKAGDQVAQGQQIGELGNSGDTSGPHMHYQLQDGPRWEFADGLPIRFENVNTLTRGSYFDAQ